MFWEIVEKCKMKKIFLFILLMFMFSLVNAEQQICVDFDPPSSPQNLEVTSSGTNIILTWSEAYDEPACSAIDYYVVSRNGNHIAEGLDVLTYVDVDVPYGTYSYSVYAVDKVAHFGGLAIKNDVVLSAPDNGGGGGNTNVGGGGGGTSYVCYEEWQCGDWGECFGEQQTRSCTDLSQCGTTDYRPETSRACLVENSGGDVLSTTSITPTTGGVLAGITGAVIGTVTSTAGIIVIAFILVLVGIFVTLRIIRKRRVAKGA